MQTLPESTAALAECLVGRSWPDLLDRRESERRAYVTKPLDTRVDLDPTSEWLGQVDRRHGERRQFAEKPVDVSKFGELS